MVNMVYEEDFERQVLNSDKPVLVDFFADWCGPCKMLAPVIEELSKEITEVSFCKVNVDENPQLAATYGVSSIPNVIVFKDGEVVGNSIGFTSKEKLRELLEK